jgi:hypothetical protein
MSALMEILEAGGLAPDAGPPPRPSGSGAEAARIAREVFQAPDYWWKRTQEGPTIEASWLRAFLDSILGAIGRGLLALGRLIGRVLRALFGRTIGESSGGTLLIWLLAGALLAWAVWKLLPLILEWFRRSTPPVGAVAVESEALPAAVDLRDLAIRARREGRHAEAIRLALLAMIAALEKRGLLRYDTTRTNREYRAELRPRPELAEPFGRLARIYEGVWYGRQPAGPEQAEESIRLCVSMIDGEALTPV